ncbi:MAG: polyphosphate polymerase domain-containing protein [FCB group bacterium]|nr:polyphosphate polymerase domain-containing protein [FCB group bacterium]
MPGRQEDKYLIPMYSMDEIRKAILPYVIADNHRALQESNIYEIRSIYFDSFELKDYYEKHAGLQMRKKLRVRGYNQVSQESEVFLEIKWKNNTFISKDRTPVKYTDVANLLAGGDMEKLLPYRKDFPNSHEKASKFLFYLKRSSRVPVNLVTYTREAYIGKFNHTDRITFDSNIRSMMFPGLDDLFEEERLVPFLERDFVLEHKSENPVPEWFRRIIRKYNLSKQAYSKYVRGVDTHYRHIGDCTKREIISMSHY